MNYSNMTRRQQVRAMLDSHKGEWIDGPDLANEKVGGSEGLKRLREIRQVGIDTGKYEIEMQSHPDPKRDTHQYRIVYKEKVPVWICGSCDEPAVIPPTPMIDVTWGMGTCLTCHKTSTFRLRNR